MIRLGNKLVLDVFLGCATVFVIAAIAVDIGALLLGVFVALSVLDALSGGCFFGGGCYAG